VLAEHRHAGAGSVHTVDNPHRLPNNVSPVRYDLHLAPDLDRARFSGSVEIAVDVVETAQVVIMNAADLNVTRASAVSAGGTSMDAQIEHAADSERILLTFDNPLPAGRGTIDMDFEGELNDQLHGFYRSTFTDSEGAPHVLAATQFEATDARRAFPCFDEPDKKAVFAITLDIAARLSAVSNTALVESTDLGNGMKRLRFADTMKMSTYLVAFVVGLLEGSEPVDVDGIPLRVVHVPGKGSLVSYALEAGAHALRFFTEWFGIPYPGGKLDLVAIPDFAFGAMENLGCITFRESLLLVDPEKASRSELERMADVISHEIAHMWFGDLVTMRWWNGIWLNEAFATYMELACVDHFRPEWHRWTSFGLEREAALAIDGLATTRPVEFPVGRPEEAQGMFDVLTYQKGASVLRMLEIYMGLDRFKDGIRSYLARHQFANAETSDLWDALEEAANAGKSDNPLPIRAMMDSWILQGGYPLVEVSPEDGAGEGTRAEATSISLTQVPFSYLDGASPSTSHRRWIVPVLWHSFSGTGERQPSERPLLGGEGTTADLPDGAAGTAVVNSGGQGFYRVRYESTALARLLSRIGDLDPLERFGIVADTWAAVLAGRSPLADFFDVVHHLVDEDEPSVWSIVVGAFSCFDHIAASVGTREHLRAATRDIFQPILTRLGWEPSRGEGEQIPRLRSLVITALGALAMDPGVQERASELHHACLAGGEVDPDIAGAVVAVVAAAAGGDPAGAATYETFLERYRHPETPQEELRYLYALAGFSDPYLVERTLDLSLTEIRSQNAPFVLSQLLGGTDTGWQAWEFVTRHWDRCLERFPANTVSRMLEGAKMLCHPPERAEEVATWLANHPVRIGQRSVDQVAERLRIHARLTTHAGELNELLASR